MKNEIAGFATECQFPRITRTPLLPPRPSVAAT
jgi:hypothetical protein